MDTFMDKLTHKLNAQEVIKANTQAETVELNRLRAELKEYKAAMDEMKEAADAAVEKMNAIAQVEGSNGGDSKEIKELMLNLRNLISERTADSANEIHKECVKVYRNVQGVLIDENKKQTEEIAGKLAPVRGKITAAIVLSALALAASLGGVAFQVLVYLHIL